jgi:hypothetical protein
VRTASTYDSNVEAPDADAGELVEVYASINLAGLPRGQTVWVDPSVPEDAALIAKGRLHPTGRTATRAEITGNPDAEAGESRNDAV